MIEKSDLIVQIVDCRNPLLFRYIPLYLLHCRCPDVEVYAKEVNPHKRCVLIVNKADLIPEHVRIQWGRYFDSVNIGFVFFSAKQSSSVIEKEVAKRAEAEEKAEETTEETIIERHSENAFASLMDDEEESEEESEESPDSEEQRAVDTPEEIIPDQPVDEEKDEWEQVNEEEKILQDMEATSEEHSRYRIRSREEVLSYLSEQTNLAYEDIKKHALEEGLEWVDRRAVVGMVGFPNVGKSSLINVLLGVSASSHGAVRVAVGATPGKTKHLQTVILSDTLMLCDCPGLVFPVFMNTKADLLFNGVLPSSNMRDYIEPVRLVCQRVQREELERVYHIKLPRNPLDPPNAVPHPRQLLHVYF